MLVVAAEEDMILQTEVEHLEVLVAAEQVDNEVIVIQVFQERTD
jgi:hypothetical protein